tara:strand:- start:1532 stop:1711 length:180 start_codon:yes stop_codon:yes gene_type:complete
MNETLKKRIIIQSQNTHSSAFVEVLIARHEAEVKLLNLQVSGLKDTLKEIYDALELIKY